MTVRRPSRALRESAFSLFEVVVAAALLLLTVTVVTATVVNASAAGSRLSRTMAVDRALSREVERFRALPYCAPAYPAMTEDEYPGEREASDAVGAVFPHAATVHNTESARFVAGPGAGEAPPGSFVTVREVDGVTLTTVARFLAAGGAEPLGAGAVIGWAVWCAVPPPAGALELRVSATREGVRRDCCIRVGSLPPAHTAGGADGGGA